MAMMQSAAPSTMDTTVHTMGGTGKPLYLISAYTMATTATMRIMPMASAAKL